MASHARGERPALPARFCLFCCFRAPRIRMVCLPRANLAASGHGMKLRQDSGSCGTRQDGAPVLRRIPFVEGSCEAQPAAESAEDSCGRVQGKTMTCTKEDDQIQWEFWQARRNHRSCASRGARNSGKRERLPRLVSGIRSRNKRPNPNDIVTCGCLFLLLVC